MRCLCVPRPTKDEPVRIGLARVVPRHMMAPPQLIGAWAGCIWARIIGMDAVGADQKRASFFAQSAVRMADEGGYTIVFNAISGDALPQPDAILTGALHKFAVEHHVEFAAMYGILLPVVAGQTSRAARNRCRCR